MMTKSKKYEQYDTKYIQCVYSVDEPFKTIDLLCDVIIPIMMDKFELAIGLSCDTRDRLLNVLGKNL